MDKKDLALLGRAYAAEVEAELNKNALGFMQTKATGRADRLVCYGLLREVEVTKRDSGLPIRFTGYELTELGRSIYLMFS